MRPTTRRPARRGAVTVEAAVVVTALLMLVFGTIDVAVAALRQAVLSHAAREGARQAAVHGRLAPSGWNGGRWAVSVIGGTPGGGVPTLTQAADNPGWPASAVRPALVGCTLAETTVKAEWLDRSDVPGKRVRVTVSTPYRPMMGFVFGNRTFTLSASSTVLVSH